VQLELLRGRRISFVEQVAAAQATLRQLSATPPTPGSPNAERLLSLESRIAELLAKRADAEQAVRCVPLSRMCPNPLSPPRLSFRMWPTPLFPPICPPAPPPMGDGHVAGDQRLGLGGGRRTLTAWRACDRASEDLIGRLQMNTDRVAGM
jgi:hypothetical protein